MILDFPENLENNRVILTRLKKDDVQFLETIAFKEPTLLKYSPSEINTRPKLESYINVALTGFQNGIRFPYLIFDKEKQSFAGCTSFGNYFPEHKRVEIGWTWIGRLFQGTDLNRNIKLIMLAHAFDAMKLNRVEFRIDERNTASRKAVEKIGGKLEGILAKHTIMADGFLRNTCYYGITIDDWPILKDTIFRDIILRNEKK